MMVKNLVEDKLDRDLILELQAGELNALGDMYDRHRHLVYRTALAITCDPDMAADLLQEVFLRLHRLRGAHRSLTAAATLAVSNDGQPLVHMDQTKKPLDALYQ